MIIDIIILVIFLVMLIRGWKRGLIYSAGTIVILLVAFFLAFSFSGPAAQRIYQLVQKNENINQLTQNISADLQAGKSPDDSFEKLGVPEAYRRIITGQSPGLVKELDHLINNLGSESKEYFDRLASDLAHNLVLVTLKILCFFVIFFVSSFLLRLLLKLVTSGINKLPLVGIVNRSLGLLLAFIMAIAVCGMILSLLPGLQSTFPGLAKLLTESKLAPLIEDSQIYNKVVDTIF